MWGLMLLVFLTGFQLGSAAMKPIPIRQIEALPRTMRVDIMWQESLDQQTWQLPLVYEIERSSSKNGKFSKIHDGYLQLPMYSDYIGKAKKTFYYRVRSIVPNRGKAKSKSSSNTSKWSKVVSATTAAYNKEQFLTEIQEAGFRYFYHHAHPVCGLALEGAPNRSKSIVATGASSMGMFNIIVGVRRGFITREEGAARVLKILTFLNEKAERHHGAFSHWMDGTSGKIVRFSKKDDGVDLVETAFLAQSFIMMREAFSDDNPTELKIRETADKLWRDIQWDFFVQTDKKSGKKYLAWHWSPTTGFEQTMKITGFNESQIVYLLAMVSPTHPISHKIYKSGWQGGRYSTPRKVLDVDVELGGKIGGPLFFLHYSYMGLDPRKISHNGKSYFDHFTAITQVQKNYALSMADKFKGYDKMWGITASYGPDGYFAHAPNHGDNGTIAPTAALSSMPYLPDEVFNCAIEMYRKAGKLWGPFGFYDSFNLERNWVAPGYLGIDVGPIAPMIENHRTGMCWKIFMRAPELKKLKGLTL